MFINFLYVIVYVCVLFAFHSSNVNCIVYTLMYVHIFSYLVNKLEIRWVYLTPIEKYIDLQSRK